jgi:hypothetical protein
MPIQWQCSCGQALSAELQAAGTRMVCSGCGGEQAVPALGMLARPRTAVPPAPACPSVAPAVPGDNRKEILAAAGAGAVLLVGLLLVLVFALASQAEKRVPPEPEEQVAHSPTFFTSPARVAKREAPASRDEVKPVPLPTPAKPARAPLPTEKPLAVSRPAAEAIRATAVRPTAIPAKEVVAPSPPARQEPAPVIGPPAQPPAAGGLILPLEIVDLKAGNLAYKVRRLRGAETVAPKRLRLGVTPAIYDDMGRLLRGLGDGFKYTDVSLALAGSQGKLPALDVLFLTCAFSEPREWRAIPLLRKFVEKGGTLYASDLRYDLVLAAFPEKRLSVAPFPGAPQDLKADVINPSLRQFLGRSRIDLQLESVGWKPAVFNPAKTTGLLEAKFKALGGQTVRGRLLVKFRHQAGTVIFTSFHNASQNSALERKLLEFLVFSAVSARSEAKVTNLMLQAGFALQDLQNMKVSPGEPTQEQTYMHQGGGLQLAVGFDTLGGRLRLTLTAPDGRKITHDDAGTFLLEVPNAARGSWRYTVSPVAVPFRNFPFVLAVGKQN